VLLRGHSEQELYLKEEILELCRQRGARLFHLTGPRARGNSAAWLPDAAVRSGYSLPTYAPEIADADVYICGPARWAGNVIAEARAAGVRPDQIHHEKFDW
jgi:ferredoxin-NADP reductase